MSRWLLLVFDICLPKLMVGLKTLDTGKKANSAAVVDIGLCSHECD